jgi:galactoside 2-L-fucosyltransferase 1/2
MRINILFYISLGIFLIAIAIIFTLYKDTEKYMIISSVPFSLTNKIPQTSKSVCIELLGGLGNNLFQLASTYGIAIRNNSVPRCKMNIKLKKILKILDINYQKNDVSVIPYPNIQIISEYATYKKIINRSNHLFIGDFLQSYKYFNPNMTIQFKPSIKKQAMEYIQNNSNHSITIGVHIRRGDHINLKYLNFPPDQYFKNAINFYKFKYGNKIQFIIVSNDFKWCQSQKYFKNTHIITEKHPPELDLAILSSCNHVIMSIGTFSWWGGFMSKGDVIYYDNEFDMNHPINKNKVNVHDYYPDEWIPLPSYNIRTFSNTIVTAYFPIKKSKHGGNKYLNWMTNILSLQDPMIIFTTNDMQERIKYIRQNRKTKIIVMKLEDCMMYKKYSPKFWNEQLNSDPEKSIHSKELFIIWNEKINFLKEAIQLNPFNSKFFAWFDIGYFRNSEYNNNIMLQKIPESLNKNQVMLLNVSTLLNKKYLGGGFIGGYIEGIEKFHTNYYRYLENNKHFFIGEDQNNMYKVCESNSQLCILVNPNDDIKNKWFYISYYLKNY